MKKFGKSIIFTALFSALMATGAVAVPMDSFPFEIRFDLDEVDRLCYAGHDGDAVRYKEGLAVTPDTNFYILPGDIIVAGVDVSKVSAEVSLIYETDDMSSSRREVVQAFEEGSFMEDVGYPLLSDTNIANFYERDKLYSDSLSGMEITFSVNRHDGGPEVPITQTIYLYVCDYDDYLYFYDNSEGD